jgi:hypothetical protein
MLSCTVAQSIPERSLEQMSPSPPQVTYSEDTLSIHANNATLGDILDAVHQQTGATVDLPENATDRVVGQFGPGPVRDVLTALLNGCHFNYVLLGSTTNPSGLERIVLMSQGGSEQGSSSGPVSPQKQSAVAPQTAALDDGAELPDPPEENAEDQATQPQPPAEQQPLQPNSSGQGGALKTPEQLLQEMQQRQQQSQTQRPEQE